ncbi:predicted protein [Coccidioides posadasii str. Silveira]|uniref:Predicted protein n=2 Tax=Coccidioides posadasii TaxID=199306 RepID=E9D0M8_COCPS|nr:predicted protein [Coccidioides posadasii str. Silveira]KMM73549.1 hypothetical protein CPAG_09836 [Coccidioides posadasii RMSCC 3488]
MRTYRCIKYQRLPKRLQAKRDIGQQIAGINTSDRGFHGTTRSSLDGVEAWLSQGTQRHAQAFVICIEKLPCCKRCLERKKKLLPVFRRQALVLRDFDDNSARLDEKTQERKSLEFFLTRAESALRSFAQECQQGWRNDTPQEGESDANSELWLS